MFVVEKNHGCENVTSMLIDLSCEVFLLPNGKNGETICIELY